MSSTYKKLREGLDVLVSMQEYIDFEAEREMQSKEPKTYSNTDTKIIEGNCTLVQKLITSQPMDEKQEIIGNEGNGSLGNKQTAPQPMDEKPKRPRRHLSEEGSIENEGKKPKNTRKINPEKSSKK